MATVSHPRAGFTGDVVIANKALSFVDGVATVDFLSERDRVYLMAHGLKVDDRPAKAAAKAAAKVAAARKAEAAAAAKVETAKANLSSVQPLDGKDADEKTIKQS